MKDNQKLGSDVVLAVGISYVGFIASFVASIIVARLLKVQGKGAFSLFMVTVSTIAVFSGLGLGHGQMYYASRNPEKLAHFMPNGRVMSILFCGGVALVYFLFGWVSGSRIVSTLGLPAVILGIMVAPIMSMLVFQRQFLLSDHRYILSKSSLALSQVIPLFLYSLVYIFAHVTIERIIIAFVLSQIICFVVFQGVIARLSPSCGGVSLVFAKESLTFGIKQYLSDVVLYMTSRLDFFLVAWFIGQSALGLYSVSVSLAESAARIPSEIGTILFPAFASSRISHRGTLYILRMTFCLAVIGVLLIGAIGSYVIPTFFGVQFSDSTKLLYWLLPGVVAWSTIYVTWNHISAGGNPGLGIPIFGAAAVLNAVLNAVLLPRVGVVGASIASTVSYCLAAACFLTIFCRRQHCSLTAALIPRYEDFRTTFASVNGIWKGFTGGM